MSLTPRSPNDDLSCGMAAATLSNESDYGSDFDEDDEATLTSFVSFVETGTTEQQWLQPAFPETLDPNEREPVAHIPLSQRASQSQSTQPWSTNLPVPGKTVSQEEHDLFGPSQVETQDDSPGRIIWETEPPGSEDPQDKRTPLQRWRTAPKKPLSVTDLVSPAWCELQYSYSLSRYGKVKRTAAMKRGSEVHKKLEEQVHTTVPVDVQTKEDTWGLRIWNVIQGLRTLRATGMTRELEIWGAVDGQVINGIIDELSFNCTDPELEDALAKQERSGKQEISSDQMTISQFFGGNTLERRVLSLESRVGNLESTAMNQRKAQNRTVYLMDVKTRQSPRLPNATAMRPTHMQLMLYRKLLSDMATDAVNPDILFNRYKLDGARPFSDSLVAQLSSLDFNFSTSQADDTEAVFDADSDTVAELLSHNSLRQLWSLMTSEFQKTMPLGAESISKVLKTEFRSSKDGNVIGVRTFPYRDETLGVYLFDVMGWWKGEREAKGVEVEEAFKCGICEFAEGCSWRKDKVETAVKSSREKAAAARKVAREPV